eukprot:GFKZ01005111.1.p1 GENE.GFKZ01005111.1~~GFKZ01005111.1.p1  ORF type:complete len:193 (+),score=10.48 GFKZ01005111.1:84-662(+)
MTQHISTSVPPVIFVLSLLFYHTTELLFVLRYNPDSLSISSLLISPPYLAALFCSFLEHFLLRSFKSSILVYTLPPAILLLLAGHLFRLSAWLTANSNFSHLIKQNPTRSHVLVKHGVYRWCRHPAYLGWFLWAIATQLVMANPCCLIGYSVVSWHFFDDRIRVEEYWLVRIFGDEYLQYRAKTPTRIPFIQ